MKKFLAAALVIAIIFGLGVAISANAASAADSYDNYVVKVDKDVYDSFDNKQAANNDSLDTGLLTLSSDADAGWYLTVADGYSGTVSIAYKAGGEYFAANLSFDGVDNSYRIGDGSGPLGINHVKLGDVGLSCADPAPGEPATAPEPTTVPEPTTSPEPTTVPEPTTSPEPTTEPEPATAPEPTTVPEATTAPEPATAPEPTTVAEPAVITLSGVTGDFYFAWFDVTTLDNVKFTIPNLIMRFHGTIATINPADFTELQLTRDGAPVRNELTYTGDINSYEWCYEDITDFYFSFAQVNTEPGTYGLTGKYQGVPFTVYNKILETPPAGDAAADPGALLGVGWCWFADRAGDPMRITEISFHFDKNQKAFYLSDLSDLKLTRNGAGIAFDVSDYVFRYLEVYDPGPQTSFNLLLCDSLTQSGTYVLSGCYKGTNFVSMEITIP